MISPERPMRAGPIWPADDLPPLQELFDMATAGWRIRAACRAAPYRLFDPADDGDRTIPARAVHAVDRFCAACPVRESCGDYADTWRLTGVYGGTWRRGMGGEYQSQPVPPPKPRSRRRAA